MQLLVQVVGYYWEVGGRFGGSNSGQPDLEPGAVIAVFAGRDWLAACGSFGCRQVGGLSMVCGTSQAYGGEMNPGSKHFNSRERCEDTMA